jgi:hypothetical protein
MAFNITPTAAQHNLALRTHEFAGPIMRVAMNVLRPPRK